MECEGIVHVCAGEKLVVGRGGVGEGPVGSHSCEVVATLMHLVGIQGHPFSARLLACEKVVSLPTTSLTNKLSCLLLAFILVSYVPL
jgi:hypothetical protein